MSLYEIFRSPFLCKARIPQNILHFLVPNAFLIPSQLPLGEQMGGKLFATELSNGSCRDCSWNIDVVKRLLERLVSQATSGLAPSLHNSFQERDKRFQILLTKHFQKTSVVKEAQQGSSYC